MPLIGYGPSHSNWNMLDLFGTFDDILKSNKANMIIYIKIRSITHVATKVHVILQSFVVLTWMHDPIELV